MNILTQALVSPSNAGSAKPLSLANVRKNRFVTPKSSPKSAIHERACQPLVGALCKLVFVAKYSQRYADGWTKAMAVRWVQRYRDLWPSLAYS